MLKKTEMKKLLMDKRLTPLMLYPTLKKETLLIETGQQQKNKMELDAYDKV